MAWQRQPLTGARGHLGSLCGTDSHLANIVLPPAPDFSISGHSKAGCRASPEPSNLYHGQALDLGRRYSLSGVAEAKLPHEALRTPRDEC